jgi:hypothetical protein
MIGWSLSLGVLPNELGPWIRATCLPGAVSQWVPAFSLRKYRPETTNRTTMIILKNVRSKLCRARASESFLQAKGTEP